MRRLLPFVRSNALAFGLAAILLLAVTTTIAWAIRPTVFVRSWTARLRPCKSLTDIALLPERDRILTQEFSNGEWVAGVMEHSCCSGAGFDATIFKDSRGKIFVDRTYSFCGYEELEQLFGPTIRSLDEFYSALKKDYRLKLTEQR
jgi:hypothetical protein